MEAKVESSTQVNVKLQPEGRIPLDCLTKA